MRLTTAIVIGTLFAFLSPQAPPRALATVDGKVVDSITNEPVAGALVWVVGDRSAVTNTDAGGRFSLSVTSGDLGLMVNRAGYGKNVDLQAPAATLPITVAPNAALHNLLIRWFPLP